MIRGTFGNIRLKNLLAPGTEGGVTRFSPAVLRQPFMTLRESIMKQKTLSDTMPRGLMGRTATVVRLSQG